MKKFYLLLIFSLAAFTSQAQTFQWGTAEWNIQDNWVFNDIVDYENTRVVLTYPNPANYKLTFLNVVAVACNIFVDDATEPVEFKATAQASTAVDISYPFVEGHKYRIVTTGSALVQANLATYTTDTLSMNSDSYSISFSILGPELVNTFDVEGTMSLAITDQNWDLTYSLLDVNAIKESLGISDISEATIYGLQSNGSYVPYEYYGPGYFDGWRDADGDYTLWSGGYNHFAGHNAYPAVYSIKITEDADSIYYFFYDYWKEYDPEDSGETGGSGMQGKQRAPKTSYNSIIWDWDNGDGTITQYNRLYRVDEGKDYKGSYLIKADKKYVLINATMHFVSIDDYNAHINNLSSEGKQIVSTEYYTLSGARTSQPQHGLNIVKNRFADGSVKATKIFVK